MRINYYVITAFSDAMLAWYLLSSCVSLSVCLSQAGVVLKRLYELSCFFHIGLLPPITLSVMRKFGYLQKSGTSAWSFVPNSGVRKFCRGKSITLTTKLVVFDGSVC